MTLQGPFARTRSSTADGPRTTAFSNPGSVNLRCASRSLSKTNSRSFNRLFLSAISCLSISHNRRSDRLPGFLNWCCGPELLLTRARLRSGFLAFTLEIVGCGFGVYFGLWGVSVPGSAKQTWSKLAGEEGRTGINTRGSQPPAGLNPRTLLTPLTPN